MERSDPISAEAPREDPALAVDITPEDELASDTGRPLEVAEVVRSDLRFDPYLTCSHRFVTAPTDNLIYSWEHVEKPRMGTKWRPVREETFKAIVRAIYSNLAYAVVTGIEPPTVGISMRAARAKLTRYDPKGLSALPEVLKQLADMGNRDFTYEVSRQRGRTSTLTATPGFVNFVKVAPIKGGLINVKWADTAFAELPGAETIYLTTTHRDFKGDIRSRERIDYPDHPAADRFREEMATVNNLISGADLWVAENDGPKVFTGKRTLVRHFKLPPEETTPRFDQGGRLFGGFWQRMKRERRAFLRVGREPVAELDFSSMALRLAYIRAGLEPPSGDLYAKLPGALSEANWRPAAKLVVLTMLSREGPLKRLPSEAKGIVPESFTGPAARRAVLSAFPELEGVLEHGIGLSLQFTESQILVAALLRLASRGIVALPIHDAVLVARSKTEAAEMAMREAALEITGYALPVAKKLHAA